MVNSFRVTFALDVSPAVFEPPDVHAAETRASASPNPTIPAIRTLPCISISFVLGASDMKEDGRTDQQ